MQEGSFNQTYFRMFAENFDRKVFVTTLKIGFVSTIYVVLFLFFIFGILITPPLESYMYTVVLYLTFLFSHDSVMDM